MLQRYICGCVCVILMLFSCGCRIPSPEETRYDIPSDFIELYCYQAEARDFLGKNNAQLLENVYDLEGLPPEQFLHLTEASILSVGSTMKSVWMQKDLPEPILQYEVEKIEIRQTNGELLVLEDKQVINRLLALRRAGNGVKADEYGYADSNADFYLNLPCNLTWSCGLNADDAGNIRMYYYDVKREGWYHCDVTDILADVGNLELYRFPQSTDEQS